jgi:transketolase
MDFEKIKKMSSSMRKNMLDVSLYCKTSVHMGGGLSLVEILSTLYGEVLKFDPKDPQWNERDRVILSKGHGVLPFYTVLYESGIINKEKYYTFQTNESDLIAHPIMKLSLGIESSNGSLGHGLSMGVGLALAFKKKKLPNKVYIIMGDGECNEGSVWEAAQSAAHYNLDNLIAVVDYNKIQSDGESDKVMKSGDLAKKWDSFGWKTIEADGHSVEELYNAYIDNSTPDKPKVIVAHTVKGKGVEFMEHNNDWHHNRLTENIYNQAIEQLK